MALRRPTSAQLSRAVKAGEISVVEPTQPLRLARQSKNIERLGLLSQPLFVFVSKGEEFIHRSLIIFVAISKSSTPI